MTTVSSKAPAAPSDVRPQRGESYADYVHRTLTLVIDELDDLSAERRLFIKQRWLHLVVWMEAAAVSSQRYYYLLRWSALIGAACIPALAGLSFNGNADLAARYLIIVIGTVVAVCTALEEFHHYGDRWRHYRQTVELLKIEGWRFFQLSDPYKAFATHDQAY